MSSEWQSVAFEIIGAVLTAVVFVAQCVSQELDGAARVKARSAEKKRPN